MFKRMTYSWLPTAAGAALISLWACNNHTAPATKDDSVQESPAITSIKAQINNYPDSALLYDKLVDEYTRLQDFENASAWTDSLINRNPEKFALYWLQKGNLQRQNRQYEAAIHSYNIYLQQYPDDEAVLLNLANATAEAGRPEALKITSRIVQQFPTAENRTDAFFINGIYYSRSRQFDSAIVYFNEAISNRNTFWEAHLEKGIAYFDAGKYDQAMTTFKQLQAANPDYPDAYYWIGKCNEIAKNNTEAIKNYEMAYGLDHSFTDAKFKLDSLRQ